jgi:hypothetical protein
MSSDIERPARLPVAAKNIPFTRGGSTTNAVFTVRLYNRQELKGKASMYSTRGGILKDKEFTVK